MVWKIHEVATLMRINAGFHRYSLDIFAPIRKGMEKIGFVML